MRGQGKKRRRISGSAERWRRRRLPQLFWTRIPEYRSILVAETDSICLRCTLKKNMD